LEILFWVEMNLHSEDALQVGPGSTLSKHCEAYERIAPLYIGTTYSFREFTVTRAVYEGARPHVPLSLKGNAVN
jgi:hypothetical protein